MRQQTPVAVTWLNTRQQMDLLPIGILPQPAPRRLRIGFVRATITPQLWCIHADQAHLAAITQAKGITVIDILDPSRKTAGQLRAPGLRR
ncbi:hypothetical protein GCM10009104_26240 [Marinobacterium maritimum]|uniref:Uncharacterized protein n=1 Tax=Marinobacterium maritimum TaxID=500162 RepID=A0ABN1I8C4_9GAMM